MSIFYILAAIVILVAALEITGLTHLLHKAPPSANTRSPGASAYINKGAAPVSSPSAGGNSSNPSSGNLKTSNSTAYLIDPTGPFVSSHNPASRSQAEVSQCNTTPGASCYIEFTKDGVSQKLAGKTVDQDGAASWTWTVGQLGLASGSWKITAVATLGSQTKSASDQLSLQVQP